MRVVGTMRGWRWEDEWLGNDRGQGFSRVCKRERRMKLDGRERERVLEIEEGMNEEGGGARLGK